MSGSHVSMARGSFFLPCSCCSYFRPLVLQLPLLLLLLLLLRPSPHLTAEAIDGPSHKDMLLKLNSEWGTNFSCSIDLSCASTGVCCDSADHVVLIDFHSMNLQGSIPNAISNLTNLYSLNLASNNFSGSIPSFLSALSNLNYLVLSNNSLSSSIPSDLSTLTAIDTLDLSYNQLTGSIPDIFLRLPHIMSLNLDSLSLNGSAPPSLGTRSNLEDLKLPTSVSCPPPSLCIDGLDSSNPFCTNRCPNFCTECYQTFAAPLRFKELKIILESEIPASLDCSPSVACDASAADNFTKRVCCNEKNQIVELILPGNDTLSRTNDATRTLPWRLGDLDSLQSLTLSRQEFGGSIPMRLSRLSRLKNLDLSGNDLDSDFPSWLTTFKFLEHMDLSSTLLTGTMPSTMADLDKLTYIEVPPSVSCPQWSDDLPCNLSLGFANDFCQRVCRNFCFACYAKQTNAFFDSPPPPPPDETVIESFPSLPSAKAGSPPPSERESSGFSTGAIIMLLLLSLLLACLLIFLFFTIRRKERLQRDISDEETQGVYT